MLKIMPLKQGRRRSFSRLLYEMSEGRRTQIVLLDDRHLDIVVQPKLFVSELLNIVASHCHLKDSDKQYFGLAFYDESQQCHWLQNERRVLDHDYPRKFVVTGATLALYHLPKFHIESITHFAHPSCVELMFLHMRNQLAKGLLEADNTTLCQLGAYSMQACFGDFSDMFTARIQMKSVQLFPPRLIKDLLALSQCEDLVLECYQKHRGLSKGRAVVNYMMMAEQLQSYGVQIFEVQDKAGVSLTLGISSRGIYQYELNCLEKARRVFYWKQLENLYYRDRKFSVEVNDIGRVVHTLSSFNVYEDAVQEPVDEYDDLTEAICDPSTQVSVSRRAFLPSGVYVHVFWCESAQLCKTIWSLAIAQHQFYLDRRAVAKKGAQMVHHSVEELAAKLDKLADDGASFIGRVSSDSNGVAPRLAPSVSTTSLRSVPSSERSEEEKHRDAELCKQLKQRRQELEQKLLDKMKELKEICVQEGELTGELPVEIRRALAPGEVEPKIKRRVGTAFAITVETMTKHRKADQIARLEADVDIHRKIVAAALKLASDSSTNKSVRRKRRRDYEAARQRLRELEQCLHQLRISSSKPDLPNVHLEGALSKLTENGPGLRVCKSLPGTPHGSTPDLTLESSSTRLDFQPSAIRRLSAFSPMRKAICSSKPPLPRKRPSDQTSSAHKGLQYSTSFPNDHPSGPVAQNGDCPKTMDSIGELSPRLAHIGNGFLAKPPLGSVNGYRSRSSYQSSYRCQNYPTLSNANFGKSMSTSDSNHSLPSSSTASVASDRSGGAAVDHSVGAYNIPNQRTSWDYECVSAMTSGVVAALLQGSTESLDVASTNQRAPSAEGGVTKSSMDGRLRVKGFATGFSSEFHAGSLDRRLLNQRQRENRKPGRLVDGNANEYSPPISTSVEKSHADMARAISPRFVHRLLSTSPYNNHVPVFRANNETSKPYETSDLLKYGAIRERPPLPPSYCNVPVRKFSSPSPTNSTSSSPGRSLGNSKRADNWWTSVNGNNGKKTFAAVHPQKFTPQAAIDEVRNGTVFPEAAVQEALAWFDDQEPGKISKTPTIV